MLRPEIDAGSTEGPEETLESRRGLAVGDVQDHILESVEYVDHAKTFDAMGVRSIPHDFEHKVHSSLLS